MKKKKDGLVFAVITKICPDKDGDGNTCDDTGQWGKDEYGDRVLYIDRPYDPKKTLVHVKHDVFTLGELMVLNTSFGREVCGRGRAPRKWCVEYRRFRSLERAVACSRAVQRRFWREERNKELTKKETVREQPSDR